MNKIGIVIVNYNGEKFQNKCIESLLAMDYECFEIVVVDNNSSDASIRKLKSDFPKVVVIENADNLGVATGNNIGIKYCLEKGLDYILLLNNDIEVDKSLLSELVNHAGESIITVPKIYYYNPNNVLWFAGGDLDWKKGSAVHRGIHMVDIGLYDDVTVITYSPTCCMLIHSSVFKKIGLMDEQYFMYYDDTDFCVRLQKNGIIIKYVPQAVLWHKVSSSTGGEQSPTTVYYTYRNQLYYLSKYRKDIRFITYPYVVLRAFVKYLSSFLRKPYNRIILKAYIDYCSRKMGRASKEREAEIAKIKERLSR